MPDGYRPREHHAATYSNELQEVLTGLSQPQKTLPAKLFYDAEGCRLFGAITRLPEYYLTRTEFALLARIAPELPRLPGCALVEYGASDEAKAVAIMDAIGTGAYVPIDVAQDALADLQVRLLDDRPGLTVCPVTADFLQPLTLPAQVRGHPRFGFFPGSTIGNLTPEAAEQFLQQARQTLGTGAHLLVGVDLQKPLSILLPAYNDAEGVTAAFNRNILSHINHRFGADFRPGAFDHDAIWNPASGRIEMHLRSRDTQTVRIGNVPIPFAAGETIHTENSYKHTVEGFRNLALHAGWRVEDTWTDPDELYSLHLLVAQAPG